MNSTVAGTHSMVAGTRPWVLLRYRPGVVGQCARTVHLALLPVGGAGEVRTLCGALLPLDQVEPLAPGQGMPCTSCLLSPGLAENVSALPTENPVPVSSPQDGTDLSPQRAAARYQSWGWPVTLRGEDVCLDLGEDPVALIIPVLLAGERSGLELPWPPGVHQVTGALFLPPTVTARGPITWIDPPEPHALQLCRELDVITAIRAVQRSRRDVPVNTPAYPDTDDR